MPLSHAEGVFLGYIGWRQVSRLGFPGDTTLRRLYHRAGKLPAFHMRRIAAIVTLLAFSFAQVFAWSARGHAIIADVAASRLTPVTKGNIRLLLGKKSLASISSWADAMRKNHPETFAWHFVNIPKTAPGFSQERDCYRPQDPSPAARNDHHNCVVDRIAMFQRMLADENASKKDRVEALQFLVHLVGDVHQPLHAIDEARGGNDIKVSVFGSSQCGKYPCNLHSAWDYSLIDHAGLSERRYARRLDRLIRKDRLDLKTGGSPEDWANESHTLAREILDEDAASLDQAYWQRNISIVDQQLALAGVRLAALLNDTLGSIPTKQMKQDLAQHDTQ